LSKPFALEIFLARVARMRVLPQDLLLLSSDGQLFLDGFVRLPQQRAARGRRDPAFADDAVCAGLPERCCAGQACV